MPDSLGMRAREVDDPCGLNYIVCDKRRKKKMRVAQKEDRRSATQRRKIARAMARRAMKKSVLCRPRTGEFALYW